MKVNLRNRIEEYLCSGGLFNPEMMDHDKVRDLIIDARDEISRLETALRTIETGYGWQGKVANEALDHLPPTVTVPSGPTA